MRSVTPVFVEFIPDHIEEGLLYISEPYQTAIHKCCCGCGEEVVTPFSPADWRLTNGDKGVSITPSIGNWNYKCKSHYFIRNNQILWAGRMSSQQIEQVRKRDISDKQSYIAQLNTAKKETKSRNWFTSMIKSILSLFESIFRK
ncbi:DUF6527 family protein [Hydrogenovibrio sp. SC-1]|uniref:DUF6527 family protein n=1 Tax=Hydrogenovibrio sp. SC-1 TaxID=2065820 RepID=UPI0035164AED